MTGEVIESSENISPSAWAKLNFIADPLCSCCGIPFEISFDISENDKTKKTEDTFQCSHCLTYPPAYTRARAAIRYDDGSRSLLLAYKHGDKTHMALPFSSWMMNAGGEMLEEVDLIVPVPLHWKRLVRRRYNQAALLGQSLSKKTKIPIDLFHLKRVKNTQSQGHMGAKERRKNVKAVFSIAGKDHIFFKDKTILLVDDVYTTGATVNECAKTLLRAGAKSVHVLTVARTIYS